MKPTTLNRKIVDATRENENTGDDASLITPFFFFLFFFLPRLCSGKCVLKYRLFTFVERKQAVSFSVQLNESRSEPV